MRILKSFLALMLTLLMLVAVVPAEAFTGSAASQQGVVYTQDCTVSQNNMIAVPVYINNNPGIMGYNISVGYPSDVLTPISVTQGSAITNGSFNDSIGTSNELDTFHVIWSNSENVFGNGLLFTVSFSVDSTQFGEYDIVLNYVPADTFNESWEDVELICQGASVKVNPQTTATTLYVGDQTISTGKTNSFSVKYLQNTGIPESTLSLRLSNSPLIPKNVTGLDADVRRWNYDTDTEILTVDISAVSSSHKAGELFKVDFDVEYLAAGNYVVTLSSSVGTHCESFTLKLVNGPARVYADNITITDSIVEVPVLIQGNQGIMGFRLTFSYDRSVLHVTSVARGSKLSPGMLDNTIANDSTGTFDVVWNHSDDITEDGEILRLTFDLVAALQEDTVISVSYNQDDTFNSTWEDVELICEPFTIHNHRFNQKIKIPEALKKEANCIDDAEYFYSCECGLISSEAFFADGGSKLGHSDTDNNGICDVCGKEITFSDHSVGDLVEFGYYPQSKVTDPSLISALNAQDGQWQSYNYMSGNDLDETDGSAQSEDYMQYKDVTYQNHMYRAVKFSTYRKIVTNYKSDESTENTFQDDNGYYINNTYWFKFEPMNWRIIDPEKGLMLCETIIDSQALSNTIYLNYDEFRYQKSVTDTFYANNYAESSLREWLNNTFFNTAFSSAQQNDIQISLLENKAYQTNLSAFSSADTNDKVFLLTWADMQNPSYGFSIAPEGEDINRRAAGSDYSFCQGLLDDTSTDYKTTDARYSSRWWLRSAGASSGSVCKIDESGIVSNYQWVGATFVGVRPAISLNPESPFNPLGENHHIHVPGETVRENEVVATCEHGGSYEEVIYCTECGEELSRKTVETDILRHVSSPSVKENAVEPTCTKGGSYENVVYCKNCGTELSRERIAVSALGHADTNKDGVCDRCRTELPHEHTDENNDGLCDICHKQMVGGQHCKYCGQIHTGLGGFFTKIIHFFLGLFGRTAHEVVTN